MTHAGVTRVLALAACTCVGIVAAPATAQRPAPCGTPQGVPCAAAGDLAFVSVSAGYAHTCALTRDGIAYCWGDGRGGALGDGEEGIQRAARPVVGDLRFDEIAAGGGFTCARSAGTVSCWGKGQAVPQWPKPAPAPLRVSLATPAAALTVGRRHACVLDGERRAFCWGWNVDGETGTGASGIDASLVPGPTEVVGGHRFRSISAGTGFTCGATLDGRVVCWGSNVDGILGDTAPERCGDVAAVPCASRPVDVPLTEPVVQVSSGTGHACAVTERGGVWCWGTNALGQLGALGPGMPGRATEPHPVSIPRAGPFASVSSGGVHTCALTASRDMYCWGPDPRRYDNPDLVADDVRPRRIMSGVIAMSAGQVHFCALTARGRSSCWGDNVSGALGRQEPGADREDTSRGASRGAPGHAVLWNGDTSDGGRGDGMRTSAPRLSSGPCTVRDRR